MYDFYVADGQQELREKISRINEYNYTIIAVTQVKAGYGSFYTIFFTR